MIRLCRGRLDEVHCQVCLVVLGPLIGLTWLQRSESMEVVEGKRLLGLYRPVTVSGIHRSSPW